ncbi:acyl-CoA dehydrogenase/oxidase [Dichotomopilus funicola]|uniref:Acyl-CoA dehydrogenase/oxidase n=1 Tax=Dichotomopilus funicola TaxID=1934379 RepID=A0AAN6ZK65_9PEZI|nr:acyl-CoA dehydrogenase/oxidase [Dichotomopilus funicola]
MSFSRALLGQDVWSQSREKDDPIFPERIALHYERAQSICRESGLSLNDVRYLTKKFWDFHFDLIAARDPTAFTIATIHINLCVGTLSNFVEARPDLSNIIDGLLNFEICGEFMLTEVGHGLDARNLETTATLQPDGSFDLHTPNAAAAKAMPPTTPNGGIPRVAIVFARLKVEGQDHGVKPFLVWLCDEHHMMRGVTSRALPTRSGTHMKPLDHAITSFNHVRLFPNALLGSIAKPKDERIDFMKQIQRVSVGTLALSIGSIPAIKLGTRITALYSQRRMVGAPNGRGHTPIISFSTQQRPIVEGWVQGTVLDSYARWTVKEFMSSAHSPTVRHALGTIFKATTARASGILHELAERCGWQGLFPYNQVSELALSLQGVYIAEGDNLVLCIRLASELLGGKYSLPEPRDPFSKLAQRERAMMESTKCKIAELGGYEKHRGQDFNRHILPRCRPLIEAIGHRMAYEAAKDSGVDPKVVHLFEMLCLTTNLGWDVAEERTITPGFHDALVKAYDDVLPDMLKAMQDESDDNEYITAPIVSDESWSEFVQGLPSFEYPSDGEEGFQPAF